MTLPPPPRWLPPALVLLAIGLAFGQAIHFGYVWDDNSLFLNTPDLRTPGLIWHALWQPILPGTTYMRPLVLASFAAEFLALGTSPAWAHGINLLLHLANVSLVMALARHFVRGTPRPTLKAIVAGLIYGLHPALIEPVTWVAGRFDLMVTFFSLAALLAALKLSDWRRALAVSACFFLAALSKEMAATLPLLVFLLLLAGRDRDVSWRDLPRHVWRRDAGMYALLLATGIAYLVIRKIAMPGFVHYDAGVESDFHHAVGHAAFVGQTLIFYVKMSLWPFASINPMHPFSPEQMTLADRWVGLGALALAALASAAALWRRSVPGILFVAWFAALLPVLNILPLTIGGNIGHERFLVLPLAFLAIGLMRLPPPRFSPAATALRYALPALAAAWTVYALVSVRQDQPHWRNDLTLWGWAYAKHPDMDFVRYSYAGAAIRYQRMDIAGRILTDWKKRDPAGTDNAYFKVLYGFWQLRTGNFKEASQLIGDGLAMQTGQTSAHGPQLAQGNKWFLSFAYTALGEAQLSLRQYKQALVSLDNSLHFGPYYPAALLTKSLALYGLDRVAAGNAAFDLAQRYYVHSAGQAAYQIRSAYIASLCRGSAADATPDLCSVMPVDAQLGDQSTTDPYLMHLGNPMAPPSFSHQG